MPVHFLVENLTRHCILAANVRDAGSSSGRRRGLLDATHMDDDSGLWIDPCEAIHTFGMRLPLDILFIDRRLRVKKITPVLRPNRICACFFARSVLELKAGRAAASKTERGDQLVFRRNSAPEEGIGPHAINR